MAVLGLAMTGCNSSGSTKTKEVPPPLNIETTVLVGGQVGTFYFDLVQASGGIVPLTWTEDVSTPTQLSTIGLMLDSGGAIFGTPTSSGNHSIALRVTDLNTPADSLVGNFTIDVVPATPPVISTTSPLPNGNVGSSYSQFITASGGLGALTYTVTLGSLPIGLNLDGSTGEILGNPLISGAANFDITVMDSRLPVPGTDTVNFDLTIDPGVVANHLIINEFYPGSTDWVEILNPLPSAQDMTGWSVTWYNDGLLEDTYFFPPFMLPSSAAVAVFDNMGFDTLTFAPYTVYTGWNSLINPGEEVEFILWDATGTAVDYIAVNPQGSATHLPSNLSWSGVLQQDLRWPNGDDYLVLLRPSFVDTDSASDFVAVPGLGSPGIENPGQIPDTVFISTL
ncbi:MAG: lamin tail domain-containing protein, partial [Planctomycetota bacterium]|nr:lamin tail domain-containing protein [Planctomycetota bacterium]